MSSSSVKKMVTLMSSDKELFELEEEVALQSQTIKHMIEDGCADDSIPVPNVTSDILSKVIEYCKKHAADSSALAAVDDDSPVPATTRVTAVGGDDLKSFDAAFIEVDLATLYDLIMAANYLNIKGLLDLTCQKVADMIKGKTPEQIRRLFNIENDFTGEEEEELRRENQWAFE